MAQARDGELKRDRQVVLHAPELARVGFPYLLGREGVREDKKQSKSAVAHLAKQRLAGLGHNRKPAELVANLGEGVNLGHRRSKKVFPEHEIAHAQRVAQLKHHGLLSLVCGEPAQRARLALGQRHPVGHLGLIHGVENVLRLVGQVGFEAHDGHAVR